MVKRNEKGMLFDEIDKELSTKDRQVIADKLELLENLMLDFLHISKTDSIQTGTERFIAKNLNIDVASVREDMDLYNESLDGLLDNTVRVDSELRDKENRPSLVGNDGLFVSGR